MNFSDWQLIVQGFGVIATWILLLYAVKGLKTIREEIAPTLELEKIKSARKLYLKIKFLVSEIELIRKKKITVSERRDDSVTIGDPYQYEGQKPTYYIDRVEEIMLEAWDAYDEAFLVFKESPLEHVKPVLEKAREFSEMYAKYHCTGSLLIPMMPSLKGRDNSEIERMKEVVISDDSDTFGQELIESFELFSNYVSRYLPEFNK